MLAESWHGTMHFQGARQISIYTLPEFVTQFGILNFHRLVMDTVNLNLYIWHQRGTFNSEYYTENTQAQNYSIQI